jgi:hypothetical protein
MRSDIRTDVCLLQGCWGERATGAASRRVGREKKRSRGNDADRGVQSDSAEKMSGSSMPAGTVRGNYRCQKQLPASSPRPAAEAGDQAGCHYRRQRGARTTATRAQTQGQKPVCTTASSGKFRASLMVQWGDTEEAIWGDLRLNSKIAQRGWMIIRPVASHHFRDFLPLDPYIGSAFM